uniref:NR LBD domain-containing protein n=1 Tax=Panagrolaimus sp. ES5 TaxID=591445 RepID=A0AC34GD12_9BILA
MKIDAVQPKKPSKSREYVTTSGLKRNKRFATAAIFEDTVYKSPSHGSTESVPSVSETASPVSEEERTQSAMSFSTSECFSPRNLELINGLYRPKSILKCLIEEEMRISERRRIMFCERPVGSLLGASKSCPYTKDDIKPLAFRSFRKSIRTHILLIYEWLRAWPDYSLLQMEDQVTLLRKCVLYHTVLDPCFITMQIGDMTKFIMQNGGYVSTIEGCDEGWENEKEISMESKKMIYLPLLERLMPEVVAPMVAMNLSFEEVVALKA